MRWNRWIIGTLIAIPALVALKFIVTPATPIIEPSLRDVTVQEAKNSGFDMVFDSNPGSLRIHRCRLRVEPSKVNFGKDTDMVLGCRASAAPGDLEKWAMSRWPNLEKQPMTITFESLDLFDVGEPFVIDVAYSEPPVARREFYGPLLLANASGSEALIYFRLELVHY